MKKMAVVSLAALAAVVIVGFAVGGLANVFQARAAKDEATIAISNAGQQCVAKTSEPYMEGKRNKPVTWNISDPTGCLPTGAEVEVRFNGTVFYFSDKAKNRTQIRKLVQPFARRGKPPYHYEVWAVGGGTDYKMEDPELEIIQ
jgi:hypothetical protein